jgi:beta-carotene hydroxylase
MTITEPTVVPTRLVRARRDRRVSEVLDQTALTRRHSGFVAWPTVVLFAGLLVGFVLAAIGWWAGVLSLWVGCAINTVIVYVLFTVHHDATHKAISGRLPRWRWLDAACGTVAGAALQLSYRGFSGEHLRHHAHTNDPLRDPDAAVVGPIWTVPLKWVAAVVLRTLSSLPFGGRLEAKVMARFAPAELPAPNDRIKREMRRSRRAVQIGTAVLIASIPLGLFVPVFLLWWLPSRLAGLPLMVLFSWLPHVPFDSTARFHNTRINTFRGSTWLLLHQDRHLIHHLYPSVPWYRYQALFQDLRPLLEAEGARIEGRDSNPRRPIQLNVAPRA